MSIDDIALPDGSFFGIRRSYGNRVDPVYDGPAGYNWWLDQIPKATAVTGSVIHVSVNPSLNYWYDRSGTNWVSRFGFVMADVTDDGVSLVQTTTRNGRAHSIKFKSLSHPSTPGMFESQTDERGITTAVTSSSGTRVDELQRTYTVNTDLFVDSLVCSWASSTRLASVTWRRKVNGGSWSERRRITYAYYGTSDANGNDNDLKTSTTQLPDGSGGWNDVSQEYYRYYKAGDANGFAHGLKLRLAAEACRMAWNASVNLDTASDTTLKAYADNYFEYGHGQRVTLETSAVCSSCPGGGTSTDLFAYAENPRFPAPGFNTWSTKTVQTLPDSSTIVVYCNYAGMPMLYANIDAAGTSKWINYYLYNADGQRIWKAHPSAVNGYSDSCDDLVNGGALLNSGTGLIEVTDYYSTTDPTTGAAQYQVSTRSVRQGSGGGDVPLRSFTYTPNSGSTGTIYPVLAETVYPDASTAATTIVTTYGYTWHSGENVLATRTTTLPAVGTDHNGDGATPTIAETFDVHGFITHRTDERGVVSTFAYDELGQVSQRVLNYQSGVTGPGLNVAWDMTYDDLGRLTQTLGPSHTAVLSGTATTVRTATWNVYVDSAKPSSGAWAVDQTWSGAGYGTGSGPYTFTLIDPVSILRSDKDGRVIDRITSHRTSGSGALSSGDTFSQGDWKSWNSTQYSNQHQKDSTRVYHTIPSSGGGSSGTNYDQTEYGYDLLERLNRVKTPGGTITRTVWTAPQRPASNWVGTNDTGATASNPAGSGSPNNMVKVSENQYDGGSAGGDGNITQMTQYVSATSDDTRVTGYGYDFRDRRTSADGEVDFYEAYTYDNLDRLIQTDRYDTLVSGNLIGRRTTAYDDRGRVNQTQTFAVNPATGVVGNALTGLLWYDYSGNLLQKVDPGDAGAFSKMEYNGSGWMTASYRGYNTHGLTYAQAVTAANDVILSQTIPVYDEAGNAVSTASYDRLNDAPTSGTTSEGPLSDASDPKARISYLASWFDGISRGFASAAYGAISSFTRPSTPPASSDTILVTLTSYDAAGRAVGVIDPKGIESRTTFDAAGRTTQTIEDYGTGKLNRTTQWTYTPDGLIATLVAINPSTGDQTTTYTYGTTLSESGVARNDLLHYTAYPDSTGSSDRVALAYNRLGEARTRTDQRGTVRTFYYDKLGRLTNDCVTTNGTGTDVAVKQISRTYEVRGMLATISSRDSATQSSGTILDQVKYEYNTFGQPTKEWQDHGGAVTSSTPKVQYSYDAGGSSSNQIRLNGVTYPAGRFISYLYGSGGGMNDRLNRVAGMNEGSQPLVNYTYLGLGMVVKIGYPEADARLDLWGGTTGSFAGIDRFSRVIDQRWQNAVSSTPADVDRYQYGYDRNSNRQWRANVVGTAAVTAGLDEFYAHDNLNRLTIMERGVLNTGHTGLTGTAVLQQTWTLDEAGNWRAFEKDTPLATTVDQERSANEVNEITDITNNIGSTWFPTAYDAAGNMVGMPKVADPTVEFDATYDAWNRATAFNDVADLQVYCRYDGLNRRIVRDWTDGVATETRHVYFNNRWQNLEERVGTATIAERTYVCGIRYIDELVSWDRTASSTTTRLYACQDANFNVTALLATNTGAPAERTQYDPYGMPTFYDGTWSGLSASGVLSAVLYAGYQYDAGTGLIYARNRYYSSRLGCFTARDLLEYDHGLNLYQYCGSGAVSKTDPLGLGDVPCDKAATQKCENACKDHGGLVRCRCWLSPPSRIMFTLYEPTCADDGDCCQPQRFRLQKDVSDACSGDGRACKGDNTDCADLKARFDANQNCAQSRKTINDTCFKGGDPGHKAAFDQATAAATKCEVRGRALNCAEFHP